MPKSKKQHKRDRSLSGDRSPIARKHKKHHDKKESKSHKETYYSDSDMDQKKSRKQSNNFVDQQRPNDSYDGRPRHHQSTHRKDIKQGTEDYKQDSGPKYTRQIDRPIKREEEFDRRQEELRRRRQNGRNDHDHQNRRRHVDNIRVKREPVDDHSHDLAHGNQGGRRREQHDRDRRRNDDQRQQAREQRDATGEIEDAFTSKDEPSEKEKPNLGLSGALTEDTNSYRGIVIKYNEPPEARTPKKRWRLYPFKGTESLKVLHLHRQSAYLIGRLRRIADIPVDHPSCSKQHAVFQFRMIEEEVDGVLKRRVKPYIIDLGAANGTFVNNEKIEPQRYVELKEKDVLKFGFSSREYVLLHAKSDTTDVAEDENDEDE